MKEQSFLPPKKKKTKLPLRLLVAGLDLFLFLGFLVLLYFLPKKAALIQTLSSQLLAQQISQQDYQKTLLDLKNIAPQEKILSSSLPNAETIVDFINLIGQIENQVELKIFTFDSDVPLTDEAQNSFFPLTIIMEGSVDEITAALDLLRRSPYLFKVNRLTLSSTNLLKDSVQAAVNLVVFVDPDFEKAYE